LRPELPSRVLPAEIWPREGSGKWGLDQRGWASGVGPPGMNVGLRTSMWCGLAGDADQSGGASCGQGLAIGGTASRDMTEREQ
jgi:hypothetical protein